MKTVVILLLTLCLFSCHKDSDYPGASPASYKVKAYYVETNNCVPGFIGIDIQDAPLRKYLIVGQADTGQKDIFFCSCLPDTANFLLHNPKYNNDTFDITFRFPKDREADFWCHGNFTYPYSQMYVVKIKKQ